MPRRKSKATREIWAVDNLEGLANVRSGSATLAYLDPPFNSGRSYDTFISRSRINGAHADTMAFDDKWEWSDDTEQLLNVMPGLVSREFGEFIREFVRILGQTKLTAYLVWMAPRLFLTHNSLSDNGSLYLHCDPSSSHYLKLILDRIFLKGHFLNEIILYGSALTPTVARNGLGPAMT